MGRDKDRYEISAKRTLAIRKRRPWNVNLGICYVPSTSQTSQSDVFWTSMGLHCAIWGTDHVELEIVLTDGGYILCEHQWIANLYTLFYFILI